MENTKIQWVDNTHNFWIGCSKIHSGCKNCYAEDMMDTRFGRVNWGPDTPRSVTSPKNWLVPYKLNKEAESTGERPTIFCNSLADFFEANNAPVVNHRGEPEKRHDGSVVNLQQIRQQAWDVIEKCSHCDWIILTKRPADIPLMWPYKFVPCTRCDGSLFNNVAGKDGRTEKVPCPCSHEKPGLMRELKRMSNVFLCISISEQKHYDYMMENFLAYILNMKQYCLGFGLSIEPQLGPIDLRINDYMMTQKQFSSTMKVIGHDDDNPPEYPFSWIKVGGESGPNARKFDLKWAVMLRDQCAKFPNVKFFYKQNGENAEFDGVKVVNSRNDKKGGSYDCIPDHLQVRQSPFLTESIDPTGIKEEEMTD